MNDKVMAKKKQESQNTTLLCDRTMISDVSKWVRGRELE